MFRADPKKNGYSTGPRGLSNLETTEGLHVHIILRKKQLGCGFPTSKEHTSYKTVELPVNHVTYDTYPFEAYSARVRRHFGQKWSSTVTRIMKEFFVLSTRLILALLETFKRLRRNLTAFSNFLLKYGYHDLVYCNCMQVPMYNDDVHDVCDNIEDYIKFDQHSSQLLK